jgi:SAM-dependent methyltransferase
MVKTSSETSLTTTRQNWKSLERWFDGSKESLLRSDHEGVISQHLHHYHSRLQKFIELDSVKTILDLGCGDGRVLQLYAHLYPEKQFIGLDLSAANIRTASSKYLADNISYVTGNAIDLISVLGDKPRIDLVFSFSFLQYFDYAAHQTLLESIENIIGENVYLIHMSIPDDKHIFRQMVPNKPSLKSVARIFLCWLQSLNSADGQSAYGPNGFWWNSKELTEQLSKLHYEVMILQADSWYRFDIVAKKDQVSSTAARTTLGRKSI